MGPGKMSSSWKPHPKHPKKDLWSLSLQELMTRALITHPLSKRILHQSLRGVWGLPFPSRTAPIHGVPPGSVGTFVLLPTDQPQRVRWQPSNTSGLARGLARGREVQEEDSNLSSFTYQPCNVNNMLHFLESTIGSILPGN